MPCQRRKLFLQDKRARYTESYGKWKMPKPGTITFINYHIDKVLVHAICHKCGMKGMAYEDPTNPMKGNHLCIECKINPRRAKP